MRRLPLIAPRPPRLSGMIDALRAIEDSGVFSNGGPVVRRFEADATAQLFGGQGDCLAVANATLGLMMAIRHGLGRASPAGRLALMPSFTFAATAHAALWAGLTPLLCDSDPDDWGACPNAEEELLRTHGERIAVIVPYATFGNTIDLDRYLWLSRRHAVGIVIDAASSLDSLDAAGRGFGTGAPFAVVYSMHATKPFATAEGGLIYSADTDLVQALRHMSNFGFGVPRSATMPGINAKLPEVLGLLAGARLTEIEAICAHRATLEAGYRDGLDGLTLQRARGRRQAQQFMPALLPAEIAPARAAIMAALAEDGIGSGHYFDPHLARQSYFQDNCLVGTTPVADAIGARMLSLPITDAMSLDDVGYICAAVRRACAGQDPATVHPVRPANVVPVLSTMLVGGGPAGMALLTAASKRGRLPALADGLMMLERSETLGSGLLGGYAITSDSTAETFLSAVRDNPHPAVAAVEHHPSAVAVASYIGALGVPLVHSGPYLETIAARLRQVVESHGGQVVTGQTALAAHRTAGGLWRTRVRDGHGDERDLLSHGVVLATGGHQSIERLAAAQVAGVPLADHVGARLVRSDDVLRIGGIAALRALLADVRAPRIAIVGGSTSALATAILLLNAAPSLALGDGALTLLHRRPLRPFYPSEAAAHADGFDDFGADDICPVSKFVYRLAGFRLEARELVLRMLEIGGRTPDPRVRLLRLDDEAAALACLDRADIVIGALGYRPQALPLFDADGARIALAADGDGPLVDRHCRVIDAAGVPVPGAFGIGLAAGFVPWGALGGEASFRGQANGLWQWQNDAGAMIVEQLLTARAASRAA